MTRATIKKAIYYRIIAVLSNIVASFILTKYILSPEKIDAFAIEFSILMGVFATIRYYIFEKTYEPATTS